MFSRSIVVFFFQAEEGILGLIVTGVQTCALPISFFEVFFTDVRVPRDQIIGGRGNGWFVANNTLKHERGSLGDSSVAESRFDSLTSLIVQEELNGRNVLAHHGYRDRLLQLQGRMLALKYNRMRVVSARMKGEDPGLCEWIIKLQGCELNHQLAGFAIDVMGEYGTLYEDSPHLRANGMWQEQYMFDLGLIIGGGTAQIQKNMIGERMLGLPREPK